MSVSTDEKLVGYLKKVTTDLQETRRRLRELESAAAEPIAIVAMSCRFAGGVDSPEGLWDVVDAGRDMIGDFPTDRGWDTSDFDPGICQRGGFLSDAAAFDADFFGVSPKEALAMDPQQRLLLETTWEVLERAGVPASSLRGSATGVYVGITAQQYWPKDDTEQQQTMGHLLTGTTDSVASGRLAFILGTEGPALSIDTACSSSLVALHLAVRALRAGECTQALVGGVSVMGGPALYAELYEQGGLSADARCKAFSGDADGTGWGEGAAMLLLRPLSEARRLGEPVLAVVRGSAVNSDGASNGLTAPNGPSQQRVIRQALRDADLSAPQVDVVEAHGTGTRLGDPVEAQALLATYGQGRPDGQPLWLGSVKSNIGHTQAAAGLAGVIKMVMAMRHGTLPRTLHVDVPTPEVDWSSGEVRLATEAGSWPRTGRPRRAAVSGFGISGTNAHVVIEQAPEPAEGEAPQDEPSAPGDQARAASADSEVPATLLVTARDAKALRESAARLREFVEAHPETTGAELAAALATTRDRHPHRAVVVGAGREQLLGGLELLAQGRTGAGVAHSRARRHGGTTFLFSGQGAQRARMGRQLYEAFPAFAAAFDEITAAFAPHLSEPLSEAMTSDELVSRASIAQPALFAVEVATVELLKDWGLTPDYLLGHSLGELAAAHVAGVLDLADAAALVAARGRLMQGTTGGMASIALSEEELREILTETGQHVDIAAVNSPRSMAVSGTDEAIESVVAACEARGRRARQLSLGLAGHSASMDPILEPFGEVARTLTYHPPKIPLISDMTGELVSPDEITDPDYWVRHMRRPVRFRDGIERLAGLGVTAFLEIGPGGLALPTRECVQDSTETLTVASTMQRDHDEPETLLLALGELFTAGAPVPWEKMLAPDGAVRLDLPTYPFQRERYWLTGTGATGTAAPRRTGTAAPRTGTAPEAAAPVSAPPSESDPAELRRRLLADVRLAAADVLGFRDPLDIEPDRAFTEIGMGSMSAVRLADRISNDIGSRQPATLVFDHPTPARVVDHLVAELLGRDDVFDTDTAVRADTDDPIAIVGMACRFPGGEGPDELWRLVRDGASGVSPFPTDRGWQLDDLDLSICREGGFLADAAGFDADFFGISGREALAMDPQQRVLLEVAWEAVENAGIDAGTLRGRRTGVFAGVGGSDYEHAMSGTASSGGHLLTGTAASVVSGRIAYLLGLEGPTLTVDTACSASLVALHLAVRAVRAGECELALAGGVAIMSTERGFRQFAELGGLAGDGRCKAFSDDADGTGWSEGASMLLVERLSDARRRGHRVLALVSGTAINSDGASNGLSAPSGPAQQRVIRAALADAGARAADVDAVEAHGTGTVLGDPIEAQALMAVYGRDREPEHPLWMGSVKSNIGHAQAAGGVLGVIKMVQAMRHDVLPRTLHVERPSTKLDWSRGSVGLLAEEQPWPVSEHPRRAGVSSFGVSGTNAHVILEQAPEDPAPAPLPESGAVLPWVLTARGDGALREHAGRLADSTAETGEDRPGIGEIASALAGNRATFDHRAVVLGTDRDTLAAGLRLVAAGESADGVVTGTARSFDRAPVWIFPGQGSQWPGMANELLDSSPAFAARWDECDQAMRPHLGWSITDAARSGFGDRDPEAADVVQPMLFATMVSLARQWESWGVRPSAVIGHSQGEIAAACVAGALSVEDAAAATVLRARALRELSGKGGMLSLAATPDDVTRWIERWGDAVSVAVFNGPASTAVSGELPALRELQAEAESKGVRSRWIGIDYASHSAQVEPLRSNLLDILSQVTPRTGDIPFFSTVTADWLDTAALDAEYWYGNLRRPVRLTEAVTALARQGHQVFTEISPHPVLTLPVTQTVEEAGVTALVTGSLRRGDGTERRLMTSLAELYVNGAPVDLAKVLPAGPVGHVELPTYPFQHRRFWPDAPRSAGAGATAPRETAYETEWAPLDPSGETVTGRWLALVPADGTDTTAGAADPVLAALREDGAEVVTIPVRPDELSADTEADVAALADRIRTAAAGTTPSGVLSLAALDQAPHPHRPEVPTGLVATLVAVRALAEAGLGVPLWCLTQGATGETTNPAQAAVWGLGRTAALEYPDGWGGLIDLPDTLDEKSGRLLRAVLGGAGGEDQIRVRDGQVLGRRLVPAGLPARPGDGWRPAGTVLVTGGTGALGGHIARWLAGHGAAHVVLVSRRGPDAPGTDELLADLRAEGVDATALACDLTDPDAVTGLVGTLRDTGERVSAVVHAAGVGGSAPLSATGVDDLATMLAAKVQGALLLESALDPATLDAVVYFSSVSAVWGIRDHGAYAAANAVLDAHARNLRTRGVQALSVAWGPWGGAGMGDDAAFREGLARTGVRLIDPAEAIRTLDALLAADRTEVAVADIDWQRFLSVYTSVRPSMLFGALSTPGPDAADSRDGDGRSDGTGFADTVRGLGTVEQNERLLRLVQRICARVLDHPDPTEISAGRAFRDLGFDSLTAVEFRNELNRAMGLRLPATVVFDHPNPTELIAQLRRRLELDEPDTYATEEEARVRHALATLPLERLRRAGVLDLLTTSTDSDRDTEAGAEQESGAIDAMDTADLLSLARQSIAD